MVNDAKSEWNYIWNRKIQRVISWGRSFYNIFFRKYIEHNSSPGGVLLEIGCGSASLLKTLAYRFRQSFGLDISDVALQQAMQSQAMQSQAMLSQGSGKSIRFLRADCFRLPFDDSTLDVIWSQGLHEHFSNYIEILREEYRVCRSGGIVLAGVPYRYSYPYVWYLLSRLPKMRWLWPWTEQVFFTKEELVRVGKLIDKNSSVETLRPWLLGIIVLKIPKS